VSPATQAAFQAAQATIQTAHATWALFGATAALVLITLAAVFFGKRAADSATKTYRLEAEPVLVLTKQGFGFVQVDRNHIPPDQIYVVTGNPALVDGLVLRRQQRDDRLGPHYPDRSPVGPTNLTAEQQAPWWSLNLEIHNAGRAPAVQVELDVDLTCRVFQTEPPMLGFVPDANASTDGTPIAGTLHGGGTLTLPAIAPQSKVLVRIENHLGIGARLTPRMQGRQVDWLDARRTTQTIQVVVPEGSFQLQPSS